MYRIGSERVQLWAQAEKSCRHLGVVSSDLWAVSSEVMSYRSNTDMILKQDNKVYSGRLPILHTQKTFVSPSQELKYVSKF